MRLRGSLGEGGRGSLAFRNRKHDGHVANYINVRIYCLDRTDNRWKEIRNERRGPRLAWERRRPRDIGCAITVAWWG